MEQNNNHVETEVLDVNELIKIRIEKLNDLVKADENPFDIVKFDRSNPILDITEKFEQLEGQTVSIAGRLMSKRGMGKVSFCDLVDMSGKVQLYAQIDEVGEVPYQKYLKLDIGDLVGITGECFRTKRGEISVRVKQFTLMSKSLRPLPEKFHGLKDQDLRYRQRYVDLIVNPEVKNTFVLRSKIIKEIRSFLDNLGYIEVETPVLNTIAGGANAKPFITFHNTLDIEMYLRIATELHLKRLIVGGMEKVYEIGRIFRNEGMSIKHNPEFTTIELYEAYTDYKGMMDICESLISEVAEKVLQTTKVDYQGEEIDLTPPFARMTMKEAVKKYSGIDVDALSADALSTELKKLHIELPKSISKGEMLNLLFEEKVEENLLQPTFIYDYPVEVSPLAKRKKDDPDFTERFELFITRREIANAFSELNDPIDQKKRFLDQVEKRASGDEEANMMDDDFINALEYGMPPTGGLGIGIDRLVMLLTNSFSIRDVLLFPTMKPLEKK